MESTPQNSELSSMILPYMTMQRSLTLLQRLRELAVSRPSSREGRMAVDWLRANKAQVQETLNRAKEPYYQWRPYLNRSNNQPSWQHQQIWATGKYKGQIACGGNRIGKTELGAYICALVVTGEHPTYASPKTGRMWIVGLDSKAVDAINRPKFEAFIPERFKAGGDWSAKQQRWILSADGRTWEVYFKSVDSGRIKFQGDKINFAWIDEEPHKPEIFSEIETRLVDLQGIWLMTATPVMGTKWLKEMTERLDVFTTFAGMRENPHIPLDEIERLAKQLPEDERLVRIEGQYVVYGGRPVFDYAALDRCMLNAAYTTGTLGAAA